MLKNIKKLRIDRGISQRQLADIVGVSQQSVNKYENHNIEPDIETLIRIADYYQTTVDYLIGRTDDSLPYSYDDKTLSHDEMELIESYRKLKEAQKRTLLQFLSEMTSK